MRHLFIFLLAVSCAQFSFAQKDSANKSDIYNVNFKIEVPILAIGIAGTQYGLAKLPAHASLTPTEVLALDKSSINKFNQPVLDFPATNYTNAHHNSNYIMYSTMALPGLLMFDKNIRKDWKEFVTMYFETHTASAGLYLIPAFNVSKPRPLAYNIDNPITLRSGESTNNAFYSGHVSTTTTASFFMAKVYDDYHDLSFGQRALLYTAASIPPIAVAQYRMRAGKHFRTDVITGFAIGSAIGILVPELHKRRKNNKLSYVPIANENMIGMNIRYRF